MSTWRTVPFWTVARRVERTGNPDARLLSVYRDWGVIPRDSRDDNFNKASEDLSTYKVVQKGDLVLNKMKTWQGSLGVSEFDGIVSPAYFVCELSNEADGRFLHHLLRSQAAIAKFKANSKGIRPNQWDLPYEVLHDIPLSMPDLDHQRRIADFLDDRVARIDQIIAARERQVDRLSLMANRLSFDTIRGSNTDGPRKEVGLAWLGSVPIDWPVLSVASQFQVDLGKMLDESRQSGQHNMPYLRNTNVQWDEISTSDLKSMDIHPSERERFTVRPGDLLICEGGQPGRAAIWSGTITPLGYQKALHRARSRGRTAPEWLLECLRAAVMMEAFTSGSGQTTIAHLTNEQLRATRFPFPEPQTQRHALSALHDRRSSLLASASACARHIGLLQEYKQSLITAAVTGELDVTTASTTIPE